MFPKLKGTILERDTNVSIFACALIGFASFPVIGNSLAWLTGGWPRGFQLGTLMAALAFLAYAFYRMNLARIPGISPLKQFLIIFLLLPVGFAGVITGVSYASGSFPGLEAFILAMTLPAWIYLGGVNLFEKVPIKPAGDRPNRFDSLLNRFVLILLCLLAFIAYFKGPARGHVELGFGGSTTLTGTVAAILGGISFGSLRKGYRSIGVFLSVYLVFLATSRTGVLLFSSLLVAISLMSYADLPNVKSRIKNAAKDFGLLLVCVFVVVFPAQFSNYYPYYTSRPPGNHDARIVGVNGNRVSEWEGFRRRYGRILKLIPSALPEDLDTTNFFEKLEVTENRWEILLHTIKVVAANPWGYWPQSFEQVAKVRCDHPPLCAYPHNVALEVGFYFGWIPLVFMIFGLVALAIRAVRTLTHEIVPVRVASVALLGYLGFAQFSGNLIDNLMTVVLGTVWMFLTTHRLILRINKGLHEIT